MLQYCLCFTFLLWSQACGILTPRPGVEPAPHVLEGEVPTTEPPRKPLLYFLMGAMSQIVLKFHLSDFFCVCNLDMLFIIHKNKNILKIYESKELSKSIHSALYSIINLCRVGIILYVLLQLHRLTKLRVSGFKEFTQGYVVIKCIVGIMPICLNAI